MKGYDVYKRALNLLGYIGSDEDQALSKSLLKRSFELINQILEDLNICKISSLVDDIEASAKQLQAVCYGTAMLIAVSEGDSAKNALFAEIYNAKRSAALSGISKIEDNLPTVSYGVD